jgi:hypothetical protein
MAVNSVSRCSGRVFACFVLLAAVVPAFPVALASPGRTTLSPGEGSPDVLPGIVATQSVRSDTVWFGGDDGAGVAVQGEVWDFESPGSNGFQGWTSIDLTANPDVYFGRVTAADFTVHGDPCVPIQTGNAGMLWCGIHEDEADLRDFVAGMGYQNHMCQRALSPVWPIDPVSDGVDLAFLYFNNSEHNYDYT